MKKIKVVKPTTEKIIEWKLKAEKWDKLDEKIGKYYPETEEEDFDDSEGLIGIGEAAAIAFGYL